MAVHLGSSSEWRQILQSTTVVVADFYADWCGPCKMIAPTFESLATKYTKPKRIAFVKINVDNQRDVASQYGVRAMPTFMIFKNGSAIETIQGANPPALTAAVEKAVKLAGPTTTAGFSAPGRTLGAGGSSRQLQRPLKWDLNNFLNAIINFIGLYLVSLFSVSNYYFSHDPYPPLPSTGSPLRPFSLTRTRPPRTRSTTSTTLLPLRPPQEGLLRVQAQERRKQLQRRPSGRWRTWVTIRCIRVEHNTGGTQARRYGIKWAANYFFSSGLVFFAVV